MIRRFLQNLAADFSAEQTRWIALVPIFFGLGIGIYFGLDFEPKYWISLLILEFLLLLFYFTRFRSAYHLPLFALMLITLGFSDAQLHSIYQNRRVEKIEKVDTYLFGKIKDISLSSKGKERLLIEYATDFEKPLKGDYRITTMMKDEHFAIGDCVETAATLFSPTLPAVKNPFQLERKYFFDGLSAIGYTLSETFKIKCPAYMPKQSFSGFINTFRRHTVQEINSALPPDEAGVIDALLVGEKSYIPQQITDNYRNSGLAHFLAVSGLHLGAIAGLIFFVVRYLTSMFPFIALRYDTKKIAAVAAILFAFLYLLISGMYIPAQRAFIMTSVVLIGVMFNRQAISLRMVSFAALAVLIISPAALTSVSFQMSFAAVTALVVFYEKYARDIAAWSYDRGFFFKTIYYLAGIVICDFVASLATTPFAIYHFHRVAVYTSLGNLLAGPLIAFWLMPAILACLALLPFSIMLYPLKFLAVGIGILNQITSFVAALPHSVLYVHSLGFGGFMLIVCGAIWLCVWQGKWRHYGTIAIILGCLTMFIPAPKPDAVISQNSKNIALRTQDGKLILAPFGRVDNWTKQMWKEELDLQDITPEQKKVLQKIKHGIIKDSEWISLKCKINGNCLYRDALEIKADGTVLLDGKVLDTSGGAYIYLSDKKNSYELLGNKESCRPWQICKQP